MPELQQFARDVPFVLVASKTDLRSNAAAVAQLAAQGTKPVLREQGEALAKEVPHLLASSLILT